MSALGLTTAVVLGIDVNLLGGSYAQSLNLHKHMQAAWDHPTSPSYMIKKLGATEITLTSKNRITPLTASQRTVRGPHPAQLCLDEIDEMDPEIYESALGQPMDQINKMVGVTIGPQVAVTSTLQYADGNMMRVMNEAKERGLGVYSWCVASGTLVTTARGEVPIQEVTDADHVLTRNGFRKVQHVTFMGHKPTLRLSSGDKSIDVTDDHRLATRDGWLHASALATDTMSPVRPNPEVLFTELVPMGAVGGEGLEPPGARLVLAGGDDVEVLDVHAGSVPAQVVHRVPLRDGADYPLIHEAMRLDGGVLPGATQVLQSVAVTTTARPLDAVSGEHGIIVQPVWDIGVEGDDHEFVANGFLVHNCYRESNNPIDGWLTDAQIEHKKSTVSAERWRVEYELGEPSIGNRAIATPAVESAFVGDPADGEIKVQKDYEEYAFETYKRAEDYVIAADWARSQDYTVITVWRATTLPMQLVYYVRMNHLPWPVMIKKFNDLQQRYRAEGIHDATGLGDVVASLIQDNNTWDFKMTGADRDDMLSEYVVAVERGKVRAPRIQSIYSAHKYCSVDDLFSRSKEFHLPDEVCSAALAWRVVGDRFPGVSPVGLPKVDNNWMDKAVKQNTSGLGEKSNLRVEGQVRSTETEVLTGWDQM